MKNTAISRERPQPTQSGRSRIRLGSVQGAGLPASSAAEVGAFWLKSSLSDRLVIASARVHITWGVPDHAVLIFEYTYLLSPNQVTNSSFPSSNRFLDMFYRCLLGTFYDGTKLLIILYRVVKFWALLYLHCDEDALSQAGLHGFNNGSNLTDRAPCGNSELFDLF